MSILLICRQSSAIITLESERIGAVRVNRRHYPVRDHIALLDGYPDAVLHHDAEKLLSGSLYRMPTTEEQDRYYQSQRAKAMIQEGEHA